MSAVLTWVRHDLRRRWLQLVVIALLVALVVGAGAAALAGARRGASSLDRLAEETKAMNALIAANPEIQYPWAEFDDLPYVEARWGLTPLTVETKGIESDEWITAPAGDDFGFTIDKWVVLDGRRYDPETPNELVITEEFAEKQDVGVGDTITVRFSSEEQAEQAWAEGGGEFEGGLEGPTAKWTIVGIVISPWMSPESGAPDGKAAVSPATLTTYTREVFGTTNAAKIASGEAAIEDLAIISVFRLANPTTDIAKLTTDAKRMSGSEEVDVWDVYERAYNPFNDSLRFEALTLAAFGLLALLSGAFLVGSAIARSAASEASESRKALAIGMTPRQATVAAAGTTMLACAAGVVGGVLVAVVASRWFPIGSAVDFEGHPGLDVDWLVLPIVAVVASGFAAAMALFAAHRQVTTPVDAHSRRASALASRLSDVSAPVPVVMGTRLALESSPGRNSVPVRPAQFGAILAVLGVIAVLVFSSGINQTLKHPERFGQVQQAEAFIGYGGQDFVPADEVVPALKDVDYIDGVWDARQANATAEGGKLSAIVYEGQTDSGALTPTLFDGRLPESQHEVFLAVRTARALDASIGDTVKLSGSEATQSLKVTGLGFLPKGAHNGYADGAYVTGSGYASMFGTSFHFHGILLSSDGMSDAAFAKKLAKDLPGLGEQFDTPQALDETRQLRSVQKFPIALAAFLAALGIGVVGNALILAVRRRVGELAVLRAIGMTGRQTAATVLTQALVLILVGLAFGIPLGLAIGRIAWQAVASFMPIQYVAPAWGMPLLYVSVVALAVALVLALWPARRAARFHIASVLRAE